MKKSYYIKFAKGDEYKGTAKEIVTQLRDSSRFDRVLTPRQYMYIVARRYNFATGLKFKTWSYDSFIKSLGKSLIVDEFKELE